ncbi:hypothetical protein GCM10010109_85210 [Actinoplanes campanulatus]|nr:hypothetical protein GCM10010109_85210 [Actinoplanes campanulatus]GID40488.1 hypothetical protein Aca09nite_69940 [Actinoplanes campanulatus]
MVRILLRVRRFFCDNPECRSKTFVEQVDGLTRRWSRMSEELRQMLTAIAYSHALPRCTTTAPFRQADI